MDVTQVDQAYQSHSQELFGRLYSLTRDSQEAQDLLQESYVRLLNEVRAGRAPLNPRAWLYRVSHNLHISRGRRQQVAIRSAARLPIRGSVPSAEQVYLDCHMDGQLDGLLAALTAADRLTVLMTAEGYSRAEIARAVGCSEIAVRARLCRARARLREQLAAVLNAQAQQKEDAA